MDDCRSVGGVRCSHVVCVLGYQRKYIWLCVSVLAYRVIAAQFVLREKICAQTQINTFKETGQNNKTMAVEFVTVVDLVKFLCVRRQPEVADKWNECADVVESWTERDGIEMKRSWFFSMRTSTAIDF